MPSDIESVEPRPLTVKEVQVGRMIYNLHAAISGAGTDGTPREDVCAAFLEVYPELTPPTFDVLLRHLELLGKVRVLDGDLLVAL